MPPPRLVCFDLGGVVVRICRSWEEGCAAAGLPYHPDLANPDLRAQRRSVNQLLQLGRISPSRYFEEVAATTHGRYSAPDVERLHRAWLLGEYPGVGALIDRLNEAGIPTAILSNTDESHWAQMTGGDPRFRAPVRVRHPHASHLLGLLKPDAGIYEAFEARVGVAPHDVLFFDDTPENIEAARVRGWAAELIDHTAETVGQMELHLRGHGVL